MFPTRVQEVAQAAQDEGAPPSPDANAAGVDALAPRSAFLARSSWIRFCFASRASRCSSGRDVRCAISRMSRTTKGT